MELFWVVGKTDVRVSSRAFSPLKFYKPNNLLINRDRSQLINQSSLPDTVEKSLKQFKNIHVWKKIPRK